MRLVYDRAKGQRKLLAGRPCWEPLHPNARAFHVRPIDAGDEISICLDGASDCGSPILPTLFYGVHLEGFSVHIQRAGDVGHGLHIVPRHHAIELVSIGKKDVPVQWWTTVLWA